MAKLQKITGKLNTILGVDVEFYRWIKAICLIVLSGFIGSCAYGPPKLYTNYKTSMIRFIGPDENSVSIQAEMEPTITVPLRL